MRSSTARSWKFFIETRGLQVAEVASRVGLSQPPCERRIQRLKEVAAMTEAMEEIKFTTPLPLSAIH